MADPSLKVVFNNPVSESDDEDKTPSSSPTSTTSINTSASLPAPSSGINFRPSLRQQNAQKLLHQFSKTFVTVMESTVFSNSSDSEGEDECFDDFERYSSYSTLEQMQPMSDEEFAFEKYFPSDQKEYLRSLFTSVAFDIFASYEYQLVMLVREKRKIGEIAEDIVHRILDNFKESQRGCNPDYIKPEITSRFLIELALQHSEPEGITYNSEWSAVEILENPGILVPCDKKKNDEKKDHHDEFPGLFYQSDWQKNFIGVKKKIGSKYGFRLKFDFETEISILKNFEKVPVSSVYPPYLQYDYVLGQDILDLTGKALEKELHIEEKMKRFGIIGEEKQIKDKVKEFQIKLQIQKQDEDRNSDKVMKQVVHLGQRVDKLNTTLERLEDTGVIKADEVDKIKSGLLRANYNVRFEVKEPGSDFETPYPGTITTKK